MEPPADQILMDPKLVGNWEGKPNGSKGGWDRHWEQQSDGTYMISGAVTESGALMARDGKIEKNLDGTQTTVEVLYKFNGSSLVTLDPDGSTVIWRPVNATASSKSRSGQSSGSQTRHTRHSGQSSGHSSIWQTIRRYFP